MAVRTSEAAVQGILIEYESTTSMTPFIEAASAMVTQHCTDDDFSSTDLELIERWLAAHFYCLSDPRTTQDRAPNGIGASYESKVDLGLNVTRYGQMAMQLDWSGALAAWNASIQAGRGSSSFELAWAGEENPDTVESDEDYA